MEFGGYHALETNKGSEFYHDLWAINTARSALQVILTNRNVEKLFIPYYTCEVLLEPIKNCNIDFEFYTINKKLEIEFDISQLLEGQYLLYTNYFGVKSSYLAELVRHFSNQIIIDNSQAFYNLPIKGIPTFYSCRKFFGVADGAYLNLDMDESKYRDLPIDQSNQRMAHLLKRIELGAEAGYADFKINDDALSGEPVKKMSQLTRNILRGLDYNRISDIRSVNFNYLNSHLSKYNQMIFNKLDGAGAMAYPLLVNRLELKQHLIENKIYIPTYWSNVKKWVSADSVEAHLSDHLLALPIDQRYGIDQMKRIVEVVDGYFDGK